VAQALIIQMVTGPRAGAEVWRSPAGQEQKLEGSQGRCWWWGGVVEVERSSRRGQDGGCSPTRMEIFLPLPN